MTEMASLGTRRLDFAVAPLGLAIGLRATQYRDYERAFVRWIDAERNPLPIAQERAERERERAERERERAERERPGQGARGTGTRARSD